MTERERWIVYPLLFLALGAALRDKIIKTTESQRIKCQGLCVFDSNDEPLLILGAEQFPELRPDAPNLVRVDRVVADEMVARARLESGQVVGNRYVITDGRNSLQLDGRYTAQLLRMISIWSSRFSPRAVTPQKKPPIANSAAKQPPTPPTNKETPQAEATGAEDAEVVEPAG